jgi:hypothetical protein
MHIKAIYLSITTNVWVKLAVALFVIVTSLIDILDDVTKLKKEHGLLTIGMFMLVRSIVELVEKVKKASKKVKEDTGLIMRDKPEK